MANLELNFLFLNEQQRQSVLSAPPALSTLQSFETFLLLTAIGRHPQAMTCLASGVESAGKSYLRIGPDDKDTSLANLTVDLNKLFDPGKGFKHDHLKKFRKKRNDITHFGYSPKDDEQCIDFSFGTALPLLNVWAEVLHGINLFDALSPDLPPDLGISFAHFGSILRMAVELIQDQSHASVGREQLIKGVQRWVVFHTRESYLANWELSVLDSDTSSGGGGWEYRHKAREALNPFDDKEEFRCPICNDSDGFLVSIDHDALNSNNPRIIPLDGICTWCDFRVSDKSSVSTKFLSMHCKDQFTDEVIDRLRKKWGYN